MSDGLLDFLRTKRSKEELKLCLDILNEFKDHESNEEWIAVPFIAWQKLEQFQDYLRLLTGTDVEKVEDEKAIEFFNNLK